MYYYVVDEVLVVGVEDVAIPAFLRTDEEKEMVKLVAKHGGFMAVNVTDEGAIADAKKSLEVFHTQPKEYGPRICFLRSAANLLSEEELRAVLAHEIAHIKNGDVFRESSKAGFWQTLAGYGNTYQNYEAERRADMAGCAAANPSAMYNALLKIQRVAAAAIAGRNDGFWFKFCVRFGNDKIMKKRLKELQKDMAVQA